MELRCTKRSIVEPRAPRVNAAAPLPRTSIGLKLAGMLFMVIESFKGGDASRAGERFKTQGRMLPDGVAYHASW